MDPYRLNELTLAQLFTEQQRVARFQAANFSERDVAYQKEIARHIRARLGVGEEDHAKFSDKTPTEIIANDPSLR